MNANRGANVDEDPEKGWRKIRALSTQKTARMQPCSSDVVINKVVARGFYNSGKYIAPGNALYRTTGWWYSLCRRYHFTNWAATGCCLGFEPNRLYIC